MNKYKLFWAKLLWSHRSISIFLMIVSIFLVYFGIVLMFLSFSFFCPLTVVVGFYLFISIVHGAEWRNNLPEYKFKKAIEPAEALAKESPPEVSAKINSLIAGARASGEMGSIVSWIEKYKKLTYLEADYNRIREEFNKLHYLQMQASLLRKDLGLSVER